MSNDDGDNIHIKLDVEQAKKLAEFAGGFVGMLPDDLKGIFG